VTSRSTPSRRAGRVGGRGQAGAVTLGRIAKDVLHSAGGLPGKLNLAEG
jgi:hypothetical protein